MTYFIGGNRIQLLRNGAEYFPALEAAILHAKREIYLQTYIYQEDVIGIKIGNSLMQAAKRGVSVYVLLDGFGSKDLSKTYIQELECAGVQVMFYRPKISPWSLKKRRLRRLHHKITVIDGNVGFVGGINIIDDYDIPNHSHYNVPPRIDYAVKLEGSLLPELTTRTHRLWRSIAWVHLRKPNVIAVKSSTNINFKSNQEYGMKAALVIRDNVLHRTDIEDAYLAAIQQAQSEITIANAYFVPGRKFRQALLAAAKRGVKVKLVLQGRMEYFLMFATQAFYSKFLSAGIEIYEYKKSFMHSKVAVIDQQWATVGSSNIDPFSLLLAREANVVIKDSAFANTLRTDIESSIRDGALQVNPIYWAQASLPKRAASWIAYSLVRIFLGVIGHASEK
jgi:cardiolipin synthase A/B